MVVKLNECQCLHCSNRYCGYIDAVEDGQEEQENRDAMVLFASDNGITMLQNAVDLFLDGTFSTCPAPFRKGLLLSMINLPYYHFHVIVVKSK
jgi:hypothetical protein